MNEATLYEMKLRLVKGAWVKTDDSTGRLDAGGSKSSEPSASFNETLELLHSLHLKQGQHFQFVKGYLKGHTKALETKIDNLEEKVDGEFTQIHNRLNSVTSQLNQMEEKINPEEL